MTLATAARKGGFSLRQRMTPLEQYIRQAAAIRGIDPNIAVRVASSEGGLHNPFRHGEGPAPKSQAPGLGPTENSYGPFQLYVSGTGAGLGDKALAAGIDPRKDWQAGVNFALDNAKQGGWGPWYGAKAAGITGMTGIGGAPTSMPGEAPMNSNDMFGSMAPTQPSASPMKANAPTGNILTNLLGMSTQDAEGVSSVLSGGEKKSPLQRLAASLKDFPNAPQAKSSMPGPSATNGSALLQYMQNPRALTDFFLKKRLQG